jgi:hypothetical protein
MAKFFVDVLAGSDRKLKPASVADHSAVAPVVTPVNTKSAPLEANGPVVPVQVTVNETLAGTLWPSISALPMLP